MGGYSFPPRRRHAGGHSREGADVEREKTNMMKMKTIEIITKYRDVPPLQPLSMSTTSGNVNSTSASSSSSTTATSEGDTASNAAGTQVSLLWIPYVLIALLFIVFLGANFWCYHKKHRERYLRKRDEKRVKDGLHERRRITVLMRSHFQAAFSRSKSNEFNSGGCGVDGDCGEGGDASEEHCELASSVGVEKGSGGGSGIVARCGGEGSPGPGRATHTVYRTMSLESGGDANKFPPLLQQGGFITGGSYLSCADDEGTSTLCLARKSCSGQGLSSASSPSEERSRETLLSVARKNRENALSAVSSPDENKTKSTLLSLAHRNGGKVLTSASLVNEDESDRRNEPSLSQNKGKSAASVNTPSSAVKSVVVPMQLESGPVVVRRSSPELEYAATACGQQMTPIEEENGNLREVDRPLHRDSTKMEVTHQPHADSTARDVTRQPHLDFTSPTTSLSSSSEGGELSPPSDSSAVDNSSRVTVPSHQTYSSPYRTIRTGGAKKGLPLLSPKDLMSNLPKKSITTTVASSGGDVRKPTHHHHHHHHRHHQPAPRDKTSICKSPDEEHSAVSGAEGKRSPMSSSSGCSSITSPPLSVSGHRHHHSTSPVVTASGARKLPPLRPPLPAPAPPSDNNNSVNSPDNVPTNNPADPATTPSGESGGLTSPGENSLKSPAGSDDSGSGNSGCGRVLVTAPANRDPVAAHAAGTKRPSNSQQSLAGDKSPRTASGQRDPCRTSASGGGGSVSGNSVKSETSNGSVLR